MLNKNNEHVKSLMTETADKTFLNPRVNIVELADMTLHSDVAGNSANIESPFGEIERLNRLWNDPKDSFANEHTKRKQQISLMIQLIAAPYEGYRIEPVLFAYDADQKIADPKTKKNIQKILDVLREHSEDTEGYKEDPNHILLLYKLRDGAGTSDSVRTLIGVYEAQSGIPVPAAEGSLEVSGMDADDYLRDHDEMKKRLRVYLTMLLDNKNEIIDRDRVNGYKYVNVAAQIQAFLGDLGGRCSSDELTAYSGEPAIELSKDVRDYIARCTPGMDPGLAVGCLGKAGATPLLDNITVMYFPDSTEPVANTELRSDGDESVVNRKYSRILLPPVRPLETEFEDPKVHYEQDRMWIRVTFTYSDGSGRHVFQRIYSEADKPFHKVLPSSLIKMYPGVPDVFVEKHLYYEVASAMEDVKGSIRITEWTLYPTDTMQERGIIRSLQYKASSSIIRERSVRARQAELKRKGEDGEDTLGTIFLNKAPDGRDRGTTVIVAIDNGASTCVRLISDDGEKPLEYRDMAECITPCSVKELKDLENAFLSPIQGNNKSYESMIQRHATEKGSPTLPGVRERLYSMREDNDFDALAAQYKTIAYVVENAGIFPYPKTNLMRMNLKIGSIRNYREAYKKQITLGLLTTVMALASREKPVAPCFNNLRICLAYPNSGLEKISESAVKEVCRQAVEYVNTYQAEDNKLVMDEGVGGNVSLYSESEAASRWMKDKITIAGKKVLVVDIGHSTTDIGLYVNNKLFGASIPCGGDEITLQSIADSYGREDEVELLLGCFSGLNSDERKYLINALNFIIKKKDKGVRLREVVGFSTTVMHMLGSYAFTVTEGSPDDHQLRMQYATELRLHMILPAVAQVILRALADGALLLHDDILLALTGKGANAFRNAPAGYKNAVFAKEIRKLIEAKDTGYSGTISVSYARDPGKEAIASGMLKLWHDDEMNRPMQVVDTPDPTETYMRILYGSDKERLRKEMDSLNASTINTGTVSRVQRKQEIYHGAFQGIINGYSVESFKKHFESIYSYGDETEDEYRALFNYVMNKFSDLRKEVEDDYEAYVMSLPGMEEEQVTAALLSRGYERMVAQKEDNE